MPRHALAHVDSHWVSMESSSSSSSSCIGVKEIRDLVRIDLLSGAFNGKIIEVSLEAEFPKIWTDGKAQPGTSSHGSQREKVRREKMQVREKVGKSRNTLFFQCFVDPSERRKVGSLKRRVRSQLAR